MLNAKISKCVELDKTIIGADDYFDPEAFKQLSDTFHEVVPLIKLLVDAFQALEKATGNYSHKINEIIKGYTDET
jgi:hypothetical protein